MAVKHKIVDIRSIVRAMSFLLIFEALFIFLSSFVSLYYNEIETFKAFVNATLITLAFGAVGILSTWKHKTILNKREGYIIVGFVWIICTAFGLLPFYLSSAIPNYTDAFFETISGFTTTGASILTDIESLPKGILFWRSIIQWIGGMGIIVLSLAVLPLLGVSGMSLFVAEVPGPTKDKLHAKISNTAKALWSIYGGLTILEIIILWLFGMGFFDAVCHSFTTMATGGFSTKNLSVAYWNSPAIEYIIIIFMTIAGINFSLYFYLIQGKFKKFFQNEELKSYILFIAILTVTTSIGLFVYEPQIGWLENIRYSLFNIVSLMTTTGFANSDYMQWAPFIWTLMLITMLLGGSAGSTAGGIKTVRILLLLKNTYYEFKRLIHPNAIVPIRYNNQVVKSELISNITAFMSLYTGIIIISIIILTAAGLGFDEAVGSTFTAIGNVGPGVGEVGPAANFSILSPFAKWYMSFLMLVGRLELFTIMMIFTVAFWKK